VCKFAGVSLREQDEQGKLKPFDSAVVTVTIVEGTKQYMIAQALLFH